MILVTGSRAWPRDKKKVIFDALDKANPDIVVCGGAAGPDTWARQWCERNGRICYVYYPDWKALGKQAGIARNMKMFDDNYLEIELILAFPHGEAKGTNHMVGYVERNLERWEDISPHNHPKPKLKVYRL